MMAKEFFGRIVLCRSIKRMELTHDNLFEACRVLALNEKQVNDKSFTYIYEAFNHIITLSFDNVIEFGDQLMVQVIMDSRNEDGDITVTITKKLPNKNYNYAMTFRGSISANNMIGNNDSSFTGKEENVEDVIELISKVLYDKLSKVKRWY